MSKQFISGGANEKNSLRSLALSLYSDGQLFNLSSEPKKARYFFNEDKI